MCVYVHVHIYLHALLIYTHIIYRYSYHDISECNLQLHIPSLEYIVQKYVEISAPKMGVHLLQCPTVIPAFRTPANTYPYAKTTTCHE